MAFNWKCPFCNHNSTIGEGNTSAQTFQFFHGNRYGTLNVVTTAIVCPNKECKEVSISAFLDQLISGGFKRIRDWQLIPSSQAKAFPDYIPQSILNDYNEACAIQNLSPKASATLSRRCLQGMIRSFFGVSKGRLVDEITAIQPQVDPTTWAAIEAVRKIGNIGAHMEKDINVIVDVEPEEAGLLIGLIEMLINDWYIVKHEREQQLARLIATAGEKDAAKKAPPTP